MFQLLCQDESIPTGCMEHGVGKDFEYVSAQWERMSPLIGLIGAVCRSDQLVLSVLPAERAVWVQVLDLCWTFAHFVPNLTTSFPKVYVLF